MRRLAFAAGVLLLGICLVLCHGLPTSAQVEKQAPQKGLPKQFSPKVEPAAPLSVPGLQPVKGGILRGIRGNFPKLLGYPPEQNPRTPYLPSPTGRGCPSGMRRATSFPFLPSRMRVIQTTRPSPITCKRGEVPRRNTLQRRGREVESSARKGYGQAHGRSVREVHRCPRRIYGEAHVHGIHKHDRPQLWVVATVLPHRIRHPWKGMGADARRGHGTVQARRF